MAPSLLSQPQTQACHQQRPRETSSLVVLSPGAFSPQFLKFCPEFKIIVVPTLACCPEGKTPWGFSLEQRRGRLLPRTQWSHGALFSPAGQPHPAWPFRPKPRSRSPCPGAAQEEGLCCPASGLTGTHCRPGSIWPKLRVLGARGRQLLTPRTHSPSRRGSHQLHVALQRDSTEAHSHGGHGCGRGGGAGEAHALNVVGHGPGVGPLPA